MGSRLHYRHLQILILNEIPRLDPKHAPESSKNYENIYPKIRNKRWSKRHRADMLDPHTRTNICADHDDFERNLTKLIALLKSISARCNCTCADAVRKRFFTMLIGSLVFSWWKIVIGLQLVPQQVHSLRRNYDGNPIWSLGACLVGEYLNWVATTVAPCSSLRGGKLWGGKLCVGWYGTCRVIRVIDGITLLLSCLSNMSEAS